MKPKFEFVNGSLWEEKKEIPVARNCDVAIAGGGPSGLAAAIASARTGADTLLVESQSFLGGVATSTMMAALVDAKRANGISEKQLFYWQRILRREAFENSKASLPTTAASHPSLVPTTQGTVSFTEIKLPSSPRSANPVFHGHPPSFRWYQARLQVKRMATVERVIRGLSRTV